MNALLLLLTIVQDVTGTIRPEPNSATQKALGKSKVGLWDVELCNDGGLLREIARERILREAPNLPLVRNARAQDILLRAAANNGYSIIGETGDTLLGFGGGVATAIGVSSKMPAAGWVGVGMSGAQILFRFFAKRAPNPTPYFVELLPDKVTLGPGACGTWITVTGLVHKPQAVKIVVQFPIKLETK